jgi:hypothetical protein
MDDLWSPPARAAASGKINSTTDHPKERGAGLLPMICGRLPPVLSPNPRSTSPQIANRAGARWAKAKLFSNRSAIDPVCVAQ